MESKENKISQERFSETEDTFLETDDDVKAPYEEGGEVVQKDMVVEDENESELLHSQIKSLQKKMVRTKPEIHHAVGENSSINEPIRPKMIQFSPEEVLDIVALVRTTRESNLTAR
eukprot:TRINITY_DN198014_c2_g1_i2.p1 TRINITY_DN198014_c2_g1~~TRINITY_DN198014_c2_g1_i2.p1  ORF type:complete len:116 (+),score=24.62 TRINITY_DN198014_c2_g1_i2:101-448(+)